MDKLTLTPAYGRDYKSKKEVIADWEADKDFNVSDISSPWDGSKINKQDAGDNFVPEVHIRYNKLTKVCVIKNAGMQS